LIFLTDVDGIYEDFPENKRIISEMNVSQARQLLEERKVSEGMIPKLRGAIEAIEQGVQRVHFLNGKAEHSLLLELFTEKGGGTMIKGED